jgi:hypothetical protein
VGRVTHHKRHAHEHRRKQLRRHVGDRAHQQPAR